MLDVTWANDLTFDGCLGVREKVFVKEQGFALEDERDEKDEYAFHALVSEDGIPCATGRVYEEEDGVFHIGRVAVLKEKRGMGLGDLVMRVLLQRALDEGARRVVLGAQLHAEPFYKRFGFERCGPDFDDAGSPHVPMAAERAALEALFNCAGCGGCGCGAGAHCHTDCERG